MKQNHPFLNRYFVDEHGRRVYAQPSVYGKVAKLLGLQKSRKILPLVKVVKQGEQVFIPLFVADKTQTVQAGWTLTLESGEILAGKCKRNSIDLPRDLPLGYHQLSLNGKTAECRIIVTPERAYQPQELAEHKKLWGAILQLYTLRSAQNWGIGDFGDLAEFLTKLAEKGGDFVGLNPIHSLFPANPEGASPYSPSSRLWQNIAYINVGAIEAFQQSREAQAWFNSADIQRQLHEARQ